jgi:predicted transcriptional regulator
MENIVFYYTLRGMANVPHPETVTVSFTLPKALAEAVDRLARQNLTNKSDIIRRALLAFLPAEEAAEIVGKVTELAERRTAPPLIVVESRVAEDPVQYKVKKGKKP